MCKYRSTVFLILSLFILCAMLLACDTDFQTPPLSNTVTGTYKPETTEMIPPAESETLPPQMTDTEPTTTEPLITEDTVTETEESTAGVDPIYSYSLDIERNDLMIFDGAGYDYGYVNAIRPGNYTIIEEKVDTEGNIWGKLKSGAGWINVSLALETNARLLPVSVGIFNPILLGEGEHHTFVKDDTAPAIALLFRASETLTNVRFSSLDFDTDTYRVVKEHYTLPTLTEDKPLMIKTEFYGDLTTYGLTFIDTNGNERHYAIYISGRNGAIMMSEY